MDEQMRMNEMREFTSEFSTEHMGMEQLVYQTDWKLNILFIIIKQPSISSGLLAVCMVSLDHPALLGITQPICNGRAYSILVFPSGTQLICNGRAYSISSVCRVFCAHIPHGQWGGGAKRVDGYGEGMEDLSKQLLMGLLWSGVMAYIIWGCHVCMSIVW